METKDYLMRYIEQLGIVLAALLGFRRRRDVKGGLEVIDEALKELTRMDSQEINAISEDELITVLTTGRNLRLEQVKFITEMLFQEAELYGMADKPDEAMQRYRKSYLLYRYIDETEKTYSQKQIERMQLLETIIGPS